MHFLQQFEIYWKKYIRFSPFYHIGAVIYSLVAFESFLGDDGRVDSRDCGD
jgi:hypothetical protein